MNSNCIFELLKQYISLRKIINRNQMATEQEVAPEDKKLLPFFLVKFLSHS